MDRIDFFKKESEVSAKRFGICDDTDEGAKTPAYIDTNPDNECEWIACVDNRTTKSVCFIAVDNKIEIRRANGEMENRCDAMLHNEDYLVFIELKDLKKNWIQHAVEEQLLPTINVFKANHAISTVRHRLAYACNKKHPQFAYSHKVYMQQFKDTTGVRLIIGRDIILKPTKSERGCACMPAQPQAY